MIKARPLCKWFDLWVGVYWDGKARRLYVLPIPCIGVVIEFTPNHVRTAKRSERALCKMISHTHRLTARDVEQARDWFASVAQDNRAREMIREDGK